MQLLDTNILVYAEDPGDPLKRDRSIEIIARLAASGLGILSIQSINEYYSAVTRDRPNRPRLLSEAEAMRRSLRYMDSWPLLDVVPAATREALRIRTAHQIGFWDAVLWATAKLNGIAMFLTEDLQHGQVLEGVRILNPLRDDFDLALLD